MKRWTFPFVSLVLILFTSCSGLNTTTTVHGVVDDYEPPNSLYRLSNGSNLYFIDAHSQIDQLNNTLSSYALDTVPSTMERNGVRGTILSARGTRDWGDILTLANNNPGIYPSVRTKSQAYVDNDFHLVKRKIDKQLASREFRAISEALIYHAEKFNQSGISIAPKVVVEYGDDRLEYMKNVSKRYAWPFVVHIEFRALNVDRSSQGWDYFWDGLDQMLTNNTDIDFVLNHLGQLSDRDVLKLILAHDNIYFFTAHVTDIMNHGSSWTMIFDRHGRDCVVKNEWKELFQQYPNRFIFALDNVWEKHWSTYYDKQISCWVSALRRATPEVAHAIAHGNAERMWDLPH